MSGKDSSTLTLAPRFLNSMADASPPNPAPITRTLRPCNGAVPVPLVSPIFAILNNLFLAESCWGRSLVFFELHALLISKESFHAG